MSIRSIAGAGTASQPLSVAINSMTTPRLSFSNVTLGYAAMPIFRYPQCLTNASTVLFRSTDFFPLNVYMVRDALTLGQALSDITASGVATGSSYPPLVLLAASTQLLPSPISAYNTQRDILISGPLEDTGVSRVGKTQGEGELGRQTEESRVGKTQGKAGLGRHRGKQGWEDTGGSRVEPGDGIGCAAWRVPMRSALMHVRRLPRSPLAAPPA